MEKHIPLMEESPIERLGEDECWALLAGNDLARLALRRGDGVDIFPVNYTVNDRRIFFRSAPGSKLVDLTRDPAVAFEIDGAEGRVWWSVVVRGRAHPLETSAEVERADGLALKPWIPTLKYVFVRIEPDSLSGRSFHRGPEPDRYGIQDY